MMVVIFLIGGIVAFISFLTLVNTDTVVSFILFSVNPNYNYGFKTVLVFRIIGGLVFFGAVWFLWQMSNYVPPSV